ncbi:MAG: nucleotide sugar dehydrogenase, partial [Clostridiales bacterium]|nr:nucleotide sugar dehydrogenase [Clostridiales bacterium]
DVTHEIGDKKLQSVQMHLTYNPEDLSRADIIIVAVPTPIDDAKTPDFTPLVKSSETVGKHMKKGCIVVYESTVYPGATEEICVPILEEYSNLRYKNDFTVGYSPERINPADKVHRLETIIKVVSGSDAETLDTLDALYSSIIDAGIHRASTIKVAEAAKVIENAQRDINIAFINEIAMIFNGLNIDTTEVLAAAGTKWNFLDYKPGLVGGHCIGVDPYYLAYKAQKEGYYPQMILAGRRINDEMGAYVASQAVKKLIAEGNAVRGAKALILGFTFKENVGDVRNTKVIDIVNELESYGMDIMVSDCYANKQECMNEYGIMLAEIDKCLPVDIVICAVGHDEYKAIALADMKKWFTNAGVLIDVKGIYSPKEAAKQSISYWRL